MTQKIIIGIIIVGFAFIFLSTGALVLYDSAYQDGYIDGRCFGNTFYIESRYSVIENKEITTKTIYNCSHEKK